MRNLLKKIDSLLSKAPLMSQLIKGSFAPLLAKAGSIGMVYVFTLIVSNHYGLKAMGIFSILFTSLGIVSVVSKLGFDTAIVKRIASYLVNKNRKGILQIHTFTTVWVLITACLISGVLFYFHHQLDLIFLEQSFGGLSPFKVLAYALPLYCALTINAESLRGGQFLNSYSALQNLTIFGITSILIFVWKTPSLDPLEPIQAFIAALLVTTVLSFILYFANYKGFTFSFPTAAERKSYLKESVPMMLSNSVFFLMSWADIMMIGYFLPEEQTGIYTNAARIANLNIVFLFAINSYAAPKIASFKEQGDMEALKRFAKTTSKLNMTLALPVLALILLFPEFLLSLFGEGATIGATALVVLAIGQFSNAAAGSVINVLNMTGKQVLAQNIITFAAIINLVLNFSLIPTMGIEGAAYATATSTILWNGLSVVFIYRSYNFVSVTFPWQKV